VAPQLRAEIRTRTGQLEPSGDQLLVATFFGAKPSTADAENLLLYNIDSFATAGRNGMRFELGSAAPPTPDGSHYPYRYRYALAPRAETLSNWQQGGTLASFGWTDLGTFAGEKKAAHVWLALARAHTEALKPVLVRNPLVHSRRRHPTTTGKSSTADTQKLSASSPKLKCGAAHRDNEYGGFLHA
jgi:hypothetical protein